MSGRRRVGVFGGTFDPIHIGHLAAAHDAADLLKLDRVQFVPNARPPHKQGAVVSEAADRLAIVRLAVEDNPRFEVSDIELKRPGLSYTLDTLRALSGTIGEDSDLVFLAGCDSLKQLHTWHQPERLLEEFKVVIMDRPGGE